MRKCRDADSSSFDLFLDTICNTFGGIVFLAILLAILIQTRAIVKTPDQDNESPMSAEDVRTLITKLDEAQAQHANASQALAGLPPAEIQREDIEFRNLNAEKENTETELSRLLRQQTEKTKLLGTQLEKNAQLRDANALIPQRLATLSTTVDETQTLLKTSIAERQTTIRLPHDRASASASALVLLRGSHIYLAKSPDVAASFNDTQVSAKSVLGGGIMVKPRAGTGWNLRDPSVIALIDRMRAGRYIVTVAVWPDSYGGFQKLKGSLIERKVDYQLWPQSRGEELVVFLGGGQSRVQ